MPTRVHAGHHWLIYPTIAVILGTAAARGHAANLVGLGTPPGAEACFPMAISPDGTVAVGTCRDLSLRPAPMAFVWTRDRGLVHLADPLPSQARPISAHAVSPSGDMIVGSAEDLGRGSEGYVWARGRAITGLGNAPGTSSIPTAVAPATGLVVGTLGTPSGRQYLRRAAPGFSLDLRPWHGSPRGLIG